MSDELLRSHIFASREFFETQQGVCRVLSPLTHQLAEMTPRWTKAIAAVAEAIAQAFLQSQSGSGARVRRVGNLLTQANRSAGREATKRKGLKRKSSRGMTLPRACEECGVLLENASRKYCDACFPNRREAVVAHFATAGPGALAKQKAAGIDAARSVEARWKQGLRAAENVRANAEWEETIADGEIGSTSIETYCQAWRRSR